MKGMGNMMKQAQKLQAKMLKLQEELADKTVETTAGGGMIKVVANGRQQILSIQIEKEVVDPDDVEMLQDLILAAVNDALVKSQEMVSGEMSKLAGGLKIPGM
ncbi:MAG: YbaB/EbfC family nucleoid-associated protein [Desulfobacteraceae bacterium]|nr:YbaB/EbfC family nucleoid-associated protein [Pseudomonadota bacterium]MBU4258996.1 YbaB/EbfC family nucleoid-associated protein [Pseudomonadota bacterium]MCG2758094.1 YbaB/EbfC family nucleoid-associated protein [Desulfobacteraceae bacterium]